jgi:hypothetical protein
MWTTRNRDYARRPGRTALLEHVDILELVEKEIELSEGLYHNGTGSVIRFVGRKKG